MNISQLKETLLRVYNEQDQVKVSGQDIIHMANVRMGLENVINELGAAEREEQEAKAKEEKEE